MGLSLREDVIGYVRKKYKTEMEFPWVRYGGYGAFRHGDNRKLFALMMELPRARLGLEGEGSLEALNVKTDSPLLADLLTRQAGYFPGFHVSGGNWVTVALDGTVPPEDIYPLIDMSYQLTASAKTRQATRGPKEWIIPANPGYFDILHAFDDKEEIFWKQAAGIKKGDTVFLYVGAPVSAILYRCRVTETDIPRHSPGNRLNIRALMKIRLTRRYDPARFPFRTLKDRYRILAVRGPRGVPEELSRALKR